MSTFFHGRRRKAGCITLVLACLVMLHWSRSQITVDEIHSDDSECALATGGGSLFWLRRGIQWEQTPVIQGGPAVKFGWRWSSTPYEKDSLRPAADFEIQSMRWFPGVECSVATRRRDVFNFRWVDTYASWKLSLLWFILPLTLLSAYLIVWKPRQEQRPDAGA